jgi:parallel beta-helix repeat protein
MKQPLSFLFGLIFMATSQVVLAAGPTYVKDPIAVSTNWTKDNSPYVIQNDIVVAKGAVLSLEPGVEVHFTTPANGKVGSGTNLVIQGGLRAVGNSTTPISFVPAVQGSLWGAIFFYNADSLNCIMQGCMVKGGRIVCNGASPTITQCAIYGAKSGVEVYANSQPQIVGNRITANGVGIYLYSDSANPTISGNEIYNNNMGLFSREFGMPNITGNKIYNNIQYNVVNYSVKTLTLPNNDFRSVDVQQIARTIYDGASNPSYGRVNFSPFVGMAQGQTGEVIAGAQPSASQEKPKVQEEDFWSYGRPFDAMKISNVDQEKKKPSNAVKVLAVGATAVVTVVLLFL